MPAVILDACGTLNLYASGRFVPILTTVSGTSGIRQPPSNASRSSTANSDPADADKLDERAH